MIPADSEGKKIKKKLSKIEKIKLLNVASSEVTNESSVNNTYA